MEQKRKRPPVQKRPAARPKKAAPPKKDTEVIYTQAKPFSKEKLLLRLGTVVAVVLALVLGMAIFFKVEHVEVAGCNRYTPWQIKEASGIETGSNLIFFNDAAAGSRILRQLPYVDNVRIAVRLPDTICIEIQEEQVSYAIEAADGSWWWMDCTGKLLEQTNSTDAMDYTRILGVQIADPVAGQKAVAYEPPVETNPDDPSEDTKPVVEFAHERLSTAIQILEHMEANGILGSMSSIDVSSRQDITMEYGAIYHIRLGDTSQLSRKISALSDTIRQHGDTYQGGTLDVSFTTWPDNVGFTPAEEPNN